MNASTFQPVRERRRVPRWVAEGVVFASCAFVVGVSAYSMKRAHGAAELAEVSPVGVPSEVVLEAGLDSEMSAELPGAAESDSVVERLLSESSIIEVSDHGDVPLASEAEGDAASTGATVVAPVSEYGPDVRWFDGRPVRPVKVMWMTVTAYSPDHRSCGDWADGVTASGKTVYANAGELVAADTRLLPFGSLLTVPGYADDQIVPVLDRGGAIKGERLDVLYPTHRIARRWGVQKLPVTVWEYVD